jgi:hypothetical protein
LKGKRKIHDDERMTRLHKRVAFIENCVHFPRFDQTIFVHRLVDHGQELSVSPNSGDVNIQ